MLHPGPDKTVLRARFRAVRASLTEEAYQARCRAICARLGALTEFQQASLVLIYWPKLSAREIDLRPLLGRLTGKQIALPVVDGNIMHPVLFDSAAALRPNRWGIAEPTGSTGVPLSAIEAAIIPALGADRRGHRLGYGKGYFDRFLPRLHASFICPVFRECLVDALPAEPHDIPMHILVTEDAVHHPAVPNP